MPSAIGSGLGSLGGSLANMGFGGAGTSLGNLGNWFSNPGIPPVVSAPTDVPMPNSYSGYTPPAPTAASSAAPGTVFSGDPNAGAGYTGGTSAPPYPGLTPGASGAPYASPESVVNPASGAALTGGGATGGAGYTSASAAPSPTPGGTTAATGYDPNASLWQNVQNYFRNPKNWGTILGAGADTGEAINRWLVQRTLQDPSALAKGMNALHMNMSKAMKRAVIGPVTAQAQETGQINAPGLYAQSVATALGPYQYQAQMEALREYIAALQASEGAYPEGGGWGMGGPFPAGGAPVVQGGGAS